MEIVSNAKYRFSNRLKGKHRFELFNEHYLSVRSKNGIRSIEYRLEVAPLKPKAKRVDRLAWFWLITSLSMLGCAGFLGYTLAYEYEVVDLRIGIAIIAVLFLLSAYCAVVFLRKSEHQWVFATREAGYPLVNIPYNRASRSEAAAFASRLEKAIRETTAHRCYNQKELFAGEMRMLRRLAKSGILSDGIYNSAKKQMLNNQQIAGANLS